MTEKFNFYYDESEHSRKINCTTLLSENYYDSFIVAIIGWKKSYEEIEKRKYFAFEEKYSDRKSNDELKSTTIKNKQLKHGFSSLRNDNVQYLNDFFDLFDGNIYIYFSVISKIEYVINQLFTNCESDFIFDNDLLKYTIIKGIVQYRPKEIIEGVYKSSEEFIRVLKLFLNKRIELNKRNYELKAKETEAFLQVLMILEDINEEFTINWEYRIAFEGFSKFINELKIFDYTLTIDEEGENKFTKIAAEKVGLKNVSESDSKESIGVRWADMLAGIISKFMKALRNELSYESMEDGNNKKLLSENWFKVNSSQLELYKKFSNIITKLNNAWYKSYAGLYSDDLILFIVYLNYMSHFKSVDEIKEIEYKMHAEYFNSAACEELSKHFIRLHSKLDAESIENINDEYAIGNWGQKIYYDESKQPLLHFQEESRIYNVLSVGISNNTPSVTISEDESNICYRIPKELSDWAMFCVSFANMGQNLFPAHVLFTKCNGRMHADIM